MKLFKNIYFWTLFLSIISRVFHFQDVLQRYVSMDIFFASNVIFLRLIKIIIVPIIFFSILSSIVGLERNFDFKKIVKALTIFILTSLASITIGLLMTCVLKPGIIKNNSEFIEKMEKTFQSVDSSMLKSSKVSTNIINVIIPENIFKSIYERNIPHIILFTILFAFMLRKSVIETNNEGMKKAIVNLADTFIKIANFIAKMSPVVICSTIFWLINTIDIPLLKTLNRYLICYVISVLLINYGMYSFLLKFFTKISPLKFHKIMFKNQMTAAMISSSAAVIPINRDTAVNDFKIKKENADLLIPLGASMNMNGDAMYLCTSFLFLAQIFGINLSIEQYLLFIYICGIATLGVAPIPAASIVILGSILSTFSVPIYGIGIIIAIDRILDMIRTAINITGDMVTALIIDDKDS